MTIQTYATLKTAVSEWLDRAGDATLAARFDDFLALHEQRMYYGKEAMPAFQLPECEALRIRPMETVNAAFAMGASVAQPTGFLDLIEASLNSPVAPLQVVTESVIEAKGSSSDSQARLIAISGTNFRFWPAVTGTATLRYFAKLDTPTGATVNWILTNAPGVYLNGCLAEAALYTGDYDSGRLFLSSYIADVAALNKRRQAELAKASNVAMRFRGWAP